MENEHDTILDEAEKVPQKEWFESVWFFVPSVVLIVSGAIFKIQHWPFSNLLILAGIGFYILRSMLIFFSKPRQGFEWLFFIGQLSLMGFLFVRLFLNVMYKPFVFIVLGLFAMGFLANLFKWPGTHRVSLTEEEDAEADKEEDY